MTEWVAATLGPPLLAATAVAAIALPLERLVRRAPPVLRAVLLQVALLKFALPFGVAIPLGLALPRGVAPAGAPAAAYGPLLALALAVAGGGSLVMLVRAVRGWRALRRMLAAAAPAGPALEARVERLAAALGLARVPAVLLADEIAAPFATGGAGPALVLPAGWPARLEPEALDLVLLHELAHLKRRDPAWLALASWLAVVWWFHPLFRAVVDRLRAAQEDACDDLAVAAAGADAGDYGEVLVRAVTLAAAAEPPAFAAGLGMHAVERRLRRLLDPAHDATPRALSGRARAALVLLAVVLLAAAPRFGPAPSAGDDVLLLLHHRNHARHVHHH